MTSTAYEDIKKGLEEAIAHARGEESSARVTVVHPVDVKTLREDLGMSQSQFARVFRVGLPTLRNWEQGRRAPRGPAQVLLHLISREPEVIQRLLAEPA